MYLQNGILYDGKSLNLLGSKGFLFLFGPAPGKFFSGRFANIIQKLFIELVLVFDVSVGSSIGEVGFATSACEVAALGVFSFPPCVF